jgi:hypothetical protein
MVVDTRVGAYRIVPSTIKRYVLAILIGLMGMEAVAHAQASGAQAEALFRRGRELMDQQKYDQACAAFAESQKLEPATTTLLNLAGCREKAMQFASAWGLFLEAERQTRHATDANTKKLHAVALDRTRKLESRVSKLTINVPSKSSVSGLEITRGSDPVTSGMWNQPLPVDGGTYTITASAPGKKAWTAQVTIAAEADVKTVEIPELSAAPVTEPASTEPATSASSVEHVGEEPELVTSRSRAPAFVVGGVGVGLLAGALGLELWGRSTYEDAKAEMNDQARRDDLYDSANTKRYAAQGLAVAGAASLGIAVWLYMRGGEQQTSTTATRVVPSASGVSIVGSF